MNALLPSPPLLAAFALASLVLAVTPGPGVVYIVTRTLAQGRRAGLASAAGVAAGNLANAVAAGLGLAALFALSSLAFTAVKFAGAAYLVWLGVKALRAPAAAAAVGEGAAAPPAGSGRILRDGFVVALLNPKTTLFFAAFLPQFMNSTAPPMAQSLLLGALFVLIAAVTDGAYVLAAGHLAPRLRRWQAQPGRGSRLGRWLTGAVFIGLGVFTALTGSRSPR